MRITESQLRKIVREEASRNLRESRMEPDGTVAQYDAYEGQQEVARIAEELVDDFTPARATRLVDEYLHGGSAAEARAVRAIMGRIVKHHGPDWEHKLPYTFDMIIDEMAALLGLQE
jgi:hypothetical protein